MGSVVVARGIFWEQGSNLCPPALAGGFLTTAPPEEPQTPAFLKTQETLAGETGSGPHWNPGHLPVKIERCN